MKRKYVKIGVNEFRELMANELKHSSFRRVKRLSNLSREALEEIFPSVALWDQLNEKRDVEER